MPLELAGVSDAFVRAERELAAVGLGQRVTHYPANSRAANSRRVALARALAPEPDILIADERPAISTARTGAQVADLLFSSRPGAA